MLTDLARSSWQACGRCSWQVTPMDASVDDNPRHRRNDIGDSVIGRQGGRACAPTTN
jgi:hypothetical protein